MRCALCVLTFFLLAACGQSGDLYLPTEPATTAPQPAAETPAEKSDEKKETP